MQYDGDGNQTASIDGDGDTTLYGYDDADQLTSVTDPDGNVTTYALDPDGNQTLITDPNGFTTQQFFDGNGRVTEHITPNGAPSISPTTAMATRSRTATARSPTTPTAICDGINSDGSDTLSYNSEGLRTAGAVRRQPEL